MSNNLSKICVVCKIVKPLSDYYNDARAPDGKFSRCKECNREANRRISAKNATIIRIAPLEKTCTKCNRLLPIIEFSNNRNSKDGKKSQCRECTTTYNKEWNKNNEQKIQEHNKEYKGTLVYRQIRNKKRMQRKRTDPAFKLEENLRARSRAFFRGKAKSASTKELIGVPYEVACSIIEGKFPVGSGWALVGAGRRLWHLDHRRPISKFPDLLNDPEQQAICFHISNLQPLSGPDNMAKGNYYNPSDFKNEWIYANGYKWRICDNVRTKL